MLGIFSVEAQWKDDYELPAKPMLDAMASYPCAEVESHVAKTVGEFQGHLLDWDKKGSEWCFVHLWFHGSPGSVSVESSTIDLDDILCAYRSKHENNWENCVMHFGSCATMSADSSKLQEFLDETELTAISGYEIDVGWMGPLALESTYLHYLRKELKGTSTGATERHMRIIRDKLMNSHYTAWLCQALRFRMVVRGD